MSSGSMAEVSDGVDLTPTITAVLPEGDIMGYYADAGLARFFTTLIAARITGYARM
jgi:hypothetical protein